MTKFSKSVFVAAAFTVPLLGSGIGTLVLLGAHALGKQGEFVAFSSGVVGVTTFLVMCMCYDRMNNKK